MASNDSLEGSGYLQSGRRYAAGDFFERCLTFLQWYWFSFSLYRCYEQPHTAMSTSTFHVLAHEIFEVHATKNNSCHPSSFEDNLPTFYQNIPRVILFGADSRL